MKKILEHILRALYAHGMCAISFEDNSSRLLVHIPKDLARIFQYSKWSFTINSRFGVIEIHFSESQKITIKSMDSGAIRRIKDVLKKIKSNKGNNIQFFEERNEGARKIVIVCGRERIR